LNQKNASLIFLQILAPNEKRYASIKQRQLLTPALVKDAESGKMVSTSKKPADVRQKELVDIIISPVVNFYVLEMSTATINDEYDEEKLLNSLAGCNVLFESAMVKSHPLLSKKLFDALRALVERQPTILEKFFASRLLKNIISNASEGADTPLNEFVDELWGDLSGKGSRFLLYLLKTKGAGFIVVAFLESKRTAKRAKKILSPLKSKIGTTDSSAAKIVLKKI
jgi:hypothetical protein